MKKHQYLIAAPLLLLVAALLFLFLSRKPPPTNKTEINNERIRVGYGLPNDAEIKRMYTASNKKPRICNLTPINSDIPITIDDSGNSIPINKMFLEEMRQEFEMFTKFKWAKYTTYKKSDMDIMIVKPTKLSEKYVEDGRFCLGDFIPGGRVLVKSPMVENKEINSFRAVLETSEQRAEGVPIQFEELGIFDKDTSIGIAFDKKEGKWEIARTAIQAFFK